MYGRRRCFRLVSGFAQGGSKAHQFYLLRVWQTFPAGPPLTIISIDKGTGIGCFYRFGFAPKVGLGSLQMRKVRHLTLVVSAIGLSAGLATAGQVHAKPQLELLKFSGAKPAETTSTVGAAEMERTNQRVEALRKRTEQARQQLEAAKAHLRAAEAEYKAARAEKEALILRNKATELASLAGGEKSESKAETQTGSPAPGAVEPTANGRIEAPAQDFNAPQPATLQDLQPSQ